MLERKGHLDKLNRLLYRNPVVALFGARQVGKTTLARVLSSRWTQPVHFFDLESPVDVARLSDAMLAREPLRGLVVLDEIQRRSDLFPVLRVLADRPQKPARFLVLGSASPELLRKSSESFLGSPFRARRWTGSGQCSRTITPKSGTARNSPGRSESRTTPCDDTLTP